MNNWLKQMRSKYTGEQFFELTMYIGVIPAFIALTLYGYLGIFSRYGADDYCLSAFYLQKGDFISLMIERYTLYSSRYTNILFIGLVDKVFGWYNVAILPALMLVLFVTGLYFFLKEISRTASLNWHNGLCLLTASWLVYFSVLQAPNLYQTLYWRAGMTSHFAPLVFIPFFGAFLLRQIRSAGESTPSIWIRILSLVFAFVLGGFSEPPVAILITILALAIVAVWWWSDIRYRRPALAILPWALTGALLALVTLALAPANSLRLGATPSMAVLISKTLILPLWFIRDTVKSFPIPIFASIVLPGLLFYLQYVQFSQVSSKNTRVRLGIIFIVATLIGYLLIAASFAPSIYGQSYPAGRARFAGIVLLICMFMLDGAIFGILLTDIKLKFTQFAIIALLILALYPLRSTSRVFAEIPTYRQYAEKWDQRDAQMRAWKEAGVQDLVIPFLEEEVTQDLGDTTKFRLNRCASLLYGVNSILAVPIE